MSRRSELLELTRMRVKLFMREPEAVFWVFLFPVIMAVVLGFAFRESEPEPSKVVILPGSEAAVLAKKLEVAGLEVEVAQDAASARRKLRRGAIDALLEATAPPRFQFDGQRAESEMARLRVLEALARAERGGEGPELREERVTEHGSRYIDFLFPGLLGMNLMGTGIWAVGFAVVDARQKKLLKRMLVTPMRRTSFLLSFVMSRFVFLCLEVLVLLLFALWILDVPFRGSTWLFTLTSVLGALCFAGVGLLIAARPKTIEGVSGLMNFTMMPMWLCSGVFFSYERFPETLHPLMQAIPLTALNDALRDLMLDGAGLVDILPEIGVMTAWAVASFAIALKIFRWQ